MKKELALRKDIIATCLKMNQMGINQDQIRTVRIEISQIRYIPVADSDAKIAQIRAERPGCCGTPRRNDRSFEVRRF